MVRRISTQAAGDNLGGKFAGLRKQGNELIAPVAEGVIDETEAVLDGDADFIQQAAADEVAVAVVDLLEVVEVEEEDAELVAEAGGAVDLGLDGVVEVARVVKSGAVIGDGEFLDLFDGAGVVDGDGGVVGQGLQEHELIVAEAGHIDVDELDDAEDFVLGGERDAEDGAGLAAGQLVDAGGETLVLGDIGDDEGLPCWATHPAMPSPIRRRTDLRDSLASPTAMAKYSS